MKPQQGRGKRRGFQIPTVRGLENAALFYLGRYAASEFSLRRVLNNKLRRAAMQNSLFAENDDLQNQLRAAVDAIIEKHKKTGALNDASFAEMKTAGWRRAGRSARAIRQRLGQRGIARGAIDQALDHTTENGDADAAEFQAALTLARRRKLGPFRRSAAAPEQRQKDLATLARAGFSLGVARKVLGASD